GIWDYRNITPLQRPAVFGEKAVLTDEEAAAYEREENRRQNRDLVDLTKGNDQYPALAEGGTGGVVVPYNEFWYDRGSRFVVDTVNFTSKAPFQGSGENLHLVERYKLLDAKTLSYEFTVEDPTVWTRPWTVQYPMLKNPERMYEYGCQENNYAIQGILAGSR